MTLLVAMLAVLAYFVADGFFAKAPPLESLQRVTVTLSRPVDDYRSTRGGGTYAYVLWGGSSARAQVSNLCQLSGCAIPPELKALRPGDRVAMWLESDVIWQLADAKRILLPYEKTRAAYLEAKKERGLAVLPVWIFWAVLTAVVLRKRRRTAVGAAETRSP